MDLTRQRIIDATLTLISEHGMSGVTMSAVSRAAGVARQTLYNHYPDIASIVADAAAVHNDAAIAQLEQALAVVDTPTEVISQLIRHVAAISAHGGHTLDAHHGLPSDLREHLRGFDRALERFIHRALTDGAASNEFRTDLDVEIGTTLVLYLLRGLSALTAALPDDAPRIVAETIRTTLAALSTSQ